MFGRKLVRYSFVIVFINRRGFLCGISKSVFPFNIINLILLVELMDAMISNLINTLLYTVQYENAAKYKTLIYLAGSTSAALCPFEVLEEENDPGPHDRLIHQVRNSGEPFSLLIHEDETLAEVKVMIQ
ncbi:hypothetical protein L1987_56025 [Smallanthus sonchifolius]|uniref:Uncharacterized protein n=1 Tax=Smallanthus sonchifolius TaxID=185202 RepID=A0ACB9ECB4_9ASTR|nr:hypothetical protein L1987_56025 [Smallanthus sonchifolius]